MSLIHTVEALGRVYRVADDVTIALQALITGAVFDETTSARIMEGLSVEPGRPDWFVRVVDGFYVVAGMPERVATPVTAHLRFQAAGYRNSVLDIPIPATPVYPIAAVPLNLRPRNVRLQGRVTQNTSARPPIPGAQVSIRTPNILGLRTPLHSSHASGIVVRQRALTAAGAPKQLAEPAIATDRVVLNSNAGLAANQILRFGADIEAEFAVIASAGALPGEVILIAPLYRSFGGGATVQRITRGAIGASTMLARSADIGDGFVLTAAPIAADTLEIVDGAAIEYNIVSALSDIDGYYHLDALGGAATLDVQAAAAGFSPGTFSWMLDRSSNVNVANFQLS